MWARIRRFPFRRKGQSLIEMALMFTVLMIILSGLVEFGFWMLDYSSLVMATRNAGRFAIDNDHRLLFRNECHGASRAPSCDRRSASFDEDVCNEDFYCKLARLTEQGLETHSPPIYLDPARGDDIVISVFTFTAGSPNLITAREPAVDGGYWSYFGVRGTSMTAQRIRNLLASQGLAGTSAGYVLVEVYYGYEHKLGLPWIQAFVPDPLPLYAYTFMPLHSAAPTPTP